VEQGLWKIDIYLVAQKISHLCGTWRFITVFTKAFPRTICWDNWIQSMHSCYLAKLLRIGYSFYSVSERCRDIPEDVGFLCDKAAVLRDTVNGTFCIFQFILWFSNLLLLFMFYYQNVVCISHVILMSFVFRPSHPLCFMRFNK